MFIIVIIVWGFFSMPAPVKGDCIIVDLVVCFVKLLIRKCLIIRLFLEFKVTIGESQKENVEGMIEPKKLKCIYLDQWTKLCIY